MKIKDILAGDKVCISFEVFPPKSGLPLDAVMACTERISRLKPDFCSVTYGANGGASQNSVAIADHVQNKLNVTALAHFTGVMSTKADVAARCAELKRLGIQNILALRGDKPEEGIVPTGEFAYASDLMAEIHSQGDFCIGGACYPEGHVDSEDKFHDINTLRIKQEAGADFLISQMFFDNDIFYNFMYRLRDAGVTLPVLPGIMPLTSFKQIKHIKRISGTNLPAQLLAIADAFHNDPMAMQQAGIVFAANQIIDLIANGIRAVHIYTMNKPEIVEGIMHNIQHVLGRGK